MRIAVSADHAGYILKQELAAKLATQGHEILDLGTHSAAPVDYPDSAEAVALALRDEQVDRGIIVCGSGAGVSIAASKFPGVRAAACADEVTAELSRRHNDLNILCLSGDLLSSRVTERLVEIWMDTEFEGGRHQRRVEKIRQLEQH